MATLPKGKTYAQAFQEMGYGPRTRYLSLYGESMVTVRTAKHGVCDMGHEHEVPGSEIRITALTTEEALAALYGLALDEEKNHG